MNLFLEAPAPLSGRARIQLVALTVVVAVTRLAALARGPWDWDEMLFLLALRDYDVALHHPHPPGFPLFVLAAKGGVLAGLEPFRALQTVNLAASIFIVPAMVFLCRELRFSLGTAMAAAALFAFFPNVWFFGGTAFSDVSAVVLGVTASALLLRGARSGRMLMAGAIVLGIAVGFRPQNLLAGLVPGVVGSWGQLRQRRADVVAAAIGAGVLIVAASYGGAVAATGHWARYRDAVVAHQQYLADVDSFRSAIRPTLLQVADDFFIRPFRFPAITVILTALALLSLVMAAKNRRAPVLLATAMFAPFWLLAWLTLDFHSASRFSIGYMPLLAILAADAISALGRWTATGERRSSGAGAAITAAIVVAMAVWAAPAVMRARSELSPPLQALTHIRRESAGTVIYVQKRLRPFAEYYLGDLQLTHTEESLPPGAAEGVYLREGRSTPPGVTFSWPREPLWGIARRRYFDVSIEPVR